MPGIQKLRQNRAAVAKKMTALVDSSEGQKWTPDNQAEYERYSAEIKDIDGDITRREEVLALDAKDKDPAKHRAAASGISDDEANNQIQVENNIFNAWMRGGERALNQEQREFLDQKALEVKNTMSTTTGSEGGFLVPDSFSGQLLESLKDYGGVRACADVIRTGTGEDILWPTTDATSEEGEILAENTEVSDEDAGFGSKALKSFMFSSKVITVPMQLLQDSGIDLNAHLNARLQTRLGRVTNRLYTSGTGIGQPEGIVTASAAGVVAAGGNTATLSFEDLLKLIHSVDPAYRKAAMCKLMFNDATLLHMKQKKDADGRPLWLPGVSVDAPDTLYGQAYEINQEMDDLGASNKPVIFGDMKSYKVRDVNTVQLFRFTDSRYTRKGQVGFLALMRSDGRSLDTGGAIKHYQNSAA